MCVKILLISLSHCKILIIFFFLQVQPSKQMVDYVYLHTFYITKNQSKDPSGNEYPFPAYFHHIWYMGL